MLSVLEQIQKMLAVSSSSREIVLVQVILCAKEVSVTLGQQTHHVQPKYLFKA